MFKSPHLVNSYADIDKAFLGGIGCISETNAFARQLTGSDVESSACFRCPFYNRATGTATFCYQLKAACAEAVIGHTLFIKKG